MVELADVYLIFFNVFPGRLKSNVVTHTNAPLNKTARNFKICSRNFHRRTFRRRIFRRMEFLSYRIFAVRKLSCFIVIMIMTMIMIMIMIMILY